MRYAVNPRQGNLFDPAERMFSPMTLKLIRRDWPGLFRAQMLHLMPAEALGKSFHQTLGCPTKELYGMAGAIFLKEFFNLTIAQAVERYLLDAGWQFALNVNPMEASLGHATVERYASLFEANELARTIFDRVTTALVETFELNVSTQRLDSTHVFSNMAVFGRTKLMGVAIKRFLVQLRRHHEPLYRELPEEIRSRYAPAQAKLFGDFQGERTVLRQRVAEDLFVLVGRFAANDTVTARSSYKACRRILDEQCDVEEERVILKAKPGGNVMQNPSDAQATYDGHKGPGYQAQLAETCHEANGVQLITGVIVEPAHCPDSAALVPMIEQLDGQDRKPNLMYTDGSYGGDENVTRAAEQGVDLQSPVSGLAPTNGETLTVDDFAVDEATETVECCPNGCVAASSTHDAEKGMTTTVMNRTDCMNCAFRSSCPVKEIRGDYVLKHTPAQRRLAARRAEQSTEAFREHYAIRAGGESLNSQLKRKMGMGRLRVRGLPRVSLAVLLRCAGWNFLCALRAMKKRGVEDFPAPLGHLCAVLPSTRFPADRCRWLFRPQIAPADILRGFVVPEGSLPGLTAA